ncbi:MAG: peptidyl-tRNA hydrolase Pth2 [Candidatus Micrarchaeota archaeon]|nr:peptidyl-tRNA hydrolase Pth2 [Candidatus Micrarchaeota archaeon]
MGLKQAIVVRSDLKMGRGKLAAQASHASLLACRMAEKHNREYVNEWEKEGQKKIVLKVASLGELLELYEKMKKEIPCALVQDAGHTQLEPGTITCFAAGPAPEEKVDKFVRHLKLL